MKSKLIVFAYVLLLGSLPVIAQQNRGKAEATIKGKNISISYGRPALQGRDMIGMAKTGMVWRLGMDEATEIQSSGTLVVAGKELKPGKYSLWAKKTGDTQWILAFHPETGMWGDPPMQTGYVAQLPLSLSKVSNPAERLTIAVADKGGDAAVTIHWGTSQLIGSVGVK